MIRQVSVIGAGTMGNGIAHVFAQAGFKVTLIDLQQPQLDQALVNITRNLDRQLGKGLITEAVRQSTLENITLATGMNAVSGSLLVIEAATENADVKLRLFRNLDELAPPGCILATNTSSISITRIAAATSRPDSVIGMHFMNPVPVMKLVEVISGYNTSAYVTSTIVELTKKLGKTPAMANDYPGFIANRILMPMINEAIYSLNENVGTVESIDTVMKLGMSHPMGPLQLADFIGLDVCLSILNVLSEGFKNSRYAPCPLLVNMVTAGKLGIKSGEGFYVYTLASKELVVSPRFR
ncbi:MAG: 3-hydroxyacyl-CoA dehydrogenase NAD-binding domain-containing protein [Chitinophagaceae bacterium]